MTFEPGICVNVQVPVDGKPLNTTLPDGVVHVGWEISPVTISDGDGLTVRVTSFDMTLPEEQLVIKQRY
jgi:hypothetical protein